MQLCDEDIWYRQFADLECTLRRKIPEVSYDCSKDHNCVS